MATSSDVRPSTSLRSQTSACRFREDLTDSPNLLQALLCEHQLFGVFVPVSRPFYLSSAFVVRLSPEDVHKDFTSSGENGLPLFLLDAPSQNLNQPGLF